MVGALVLEQRLGEDRNDAGVGRRRILPRAEDVEVPDRDRLEAVQRREQLHVLLAHQLLQRVRRERVRRHVLALRQRVGVAVGRRRTGIDDALHLGVARRDQHVERGVDVRAIRGDGIFDRPRHRGNGRLVQHVVHALHRPPCDGEVREVAFEELDAGHVRKIAAMSRNQAIGDTHAFAAAGELFCEMGSDETGAPGDEVVETCSSYRQ